MKIDAFLTFLEKDTANRVVTFFGCRTNRVVTFFECRSNGIATFLAKIMMEYWLDSPAFDDKVMNYFRHIR